MPEERKLATILFADIVGSTATGVAHDPEVVRRVLSRAFAEMRRILESHGGTVEKFIGDAVMAVFGVPVAHDDDPDRAVRAAFRLRDRVGELSASGRIPLELRIGVNTGQVVAGIEGETLVTGPAVNEAARLQQAASAGEIFVGELTRRMTAGGVRYGDRRTISAKGIGELAAYRAEALTGDVPEQHRGIAGLRAPLVGRDDELRLLVDSFRKTASERRATLITVFGSAGVGKSRLIREFIDAIGPAGVRRGRCLPYGEGITFWPVVEMLRADSHIAATDTREQARSKLRAATLAAFGDAAGDADAVARRLSVLAGIASPDEALPGMSGDQLPQELRWGLRRYVERRAESDPLVVVFDDIHWAEPALLDLIEYLAEWSRAPLFLLCGARPELRDRRKGWGGGLMNASAIVLDPLTVEESRRLVADLLDIDALPEMVRAQVVARSEGNPLYLEEFLRILIDAGHIARRAGRWVAESSIAELVVPPTLQGLIAARLDQAPPDVKRALQHAAVVGKVFWTDALSALDGEQPADELLLEAARRDIVLELDERGLGGGIAYQFRHILIRDVAYESIPKEERARLHDVFSRWLETAAGERLAEYGDIVAYHAEQAFRHADELGEPSAAELGHRALVHLLAAGRKARRRKDARAMRSFYARAAQIAARVGASEEDRAEALVYAAIGRALEEVTPEAIADLRGAVGTARAAGPSVALVDGLLQLAYLTVSSADDAFSEAMELLDEALAAARATGDHEAVTTVLRGRAGAYWWRGDLAGHRCQLEEALAYARLHEVRGDLFEILMLFAANASSQGEFTRGRSLREEAARLADASGSLEDRRRVRQGEASMAIVEDRALDAVRAAHEVVELAERIGQREMLGRAYEFLGEALFQSGDAAGSRDALLEGLRWYDPRTMRAALPETQWRLSRAHLALGDVAAAREQAEAGRASTIATDVFSVANTARALARVRAAEGRHEEADALFGQALDSARATGYQYLSAEIEQMYAEFLIDRGRIAVARSLLTAALGRMSDPLAIAPRRRIEAALRRCDAITTA